MRPEVFEIILTSNGRGRILRFSISRAVLKALGALSFILLTIVSCGLIDFISLHSRQSEFATVASENVKLKNHWAEMEKNYFSKVSELVRVRAVVAKLAVITRVPTDDRELQAMQVAPVLSDAGSDDSDFDVVDRGPAAIGGPVGHEIASEQEFLSGGPLSDRLDRARQIAQTSEQEVVSTWESLNDRENLLASTPTIKPASGYYSSRFGYRVDPITGQSRLHAGLDIAAPYGSLVRAPADGIVSYASYENGYGNLVSIDHGFSLTTRFAHNSKILVKVGQHVHRGEPISMVGSTGRSTGAHVHYEVRIRGIPVDPANYILQDN